MEKALTHKLHTSIPVHIRLSSGDEVTAEIVGLSPAGATIEYPVEADKGVVLPLSFQLHIGKKVIPVHVKAEVLSSYLHHDLYEISLRFQELGDDEKKMLQTYVQYLENLRRS